MFPRRTNIPCPRSRRFWLSPEPRAKVLSMDKRLSVVLAVGLALAPAWAWAQSQGAPEAPSEAPAEAPSGKAAEKEKPPG